MKEVVQQGSMKSEIPMDHQQLSQGLTATLFHTIQRQLINCVQTQRTLMNVQSVNCINYHVLCEAEYIEDRSTLFTLHYHTLMLRNLLR